MFFETDHITPVEAEEAARRRVWVRVLRGIAADRRRRRRRASLATVLGAVLTTVVAVVLLVI